MSSAPLPGNKFAGTNLHNSIRGTLASLSDSHETARYQRDTNELGRAIRNPYETNLSGITLDFLVMGQTSDPEIQRKIQRIQTSKTIPTDLKDYFLHEDTLLMRHRAYGHRVVLSTSMLPRVGASIHSCGHLSLKKLMKVMARFYTMPPRSRQVLQTIVRSCYSCTVFKALQHPDFKAGLAHRGTHFLDHLVADHIILRHSFHSLGKRVTAIFTVLDTYSHFLWTFPQTNASTSCVLRDLLHIRLAFGPIGSLTVDNGGAFISNEFKKFAKNNNLKVFHTLPMSSTGAAIIENMNRQVRDNLAMRMNDHGDNLDQALADTTLFLNSKPRREQTISPFNIVFQADKFQVVDVGTDMRTLINNEMEQLNATTEKQAQPEENIRAGDLIVLRNARHTFPDKQKPKYDFKLYRVVQTNSHHIIYRDTYNKDAPTRESHIKYARR